MSCYKKRYPEAYCYYLHCPRTDECKKAIEEKKK